MHAAAWIAAAVLGSGCTPAGDDFPDLVIANSCGVAVDWRSADTGNWIGTLAPDATYVVHPATDESIETIIFTLPSGENVELSGSDRIELAECGQ